MEKEKKDDKVAGGRDFNASRSYYIYLVCPVCHRSGWRLQEGLGLTREEILNTCWEFQCPVHGSLQEKPLQASPRDSFLDYMHVSANFIL